MNKPIRHGTECNAYGNSLDPFMFEMNKCGYTVNNVSDIIIAINSKIGAFVREVRRTAFGRTVF